MAPATVPRPPGSVASHVAMRPRMRASRSTDPREPSVRTHQGTFSPSTSAAWQSEQKRVVGRIDYAAVRLRSGHHMAEGSGTPRRHTYTHTHILIECAVYSIGVAWRPEIRSGAGFKGDFRQHLHTCTVDSPQRPGALPTPRTCTGPLLALRSSMMPAFAASQWNGGVPAVRSSYARPPTMYLGAFHAPHDHVPVVSSW
jgi:hypothetical protein